MRYPSPRWTAQVLLCVFLFFCILGSPASATIHNVKTECGATGNGATDDTAAINTCIGHLVSGDTLEFPAGTYKISGALNMTVNNVTIDGSSNTAIVKWGGASGGGPIFQVGRYGGCSNSGLSCDAGPSVALSSTANELSTSFTTVSSLGVSAGDYVTIHQGGSGSSTNSGNTQCDLSGCRGEVLEVASVSGNTVTVTTSLHDTYNPSVNAAVAQKITTLVKGVTIQNITLDGSSLSSPLFIIGAADTTISGVTVKGDNGYNNSGWLMLAQAVYNLNITILTGIGGNAGSGSQFGFYGFGHVTINTMSASGPSGGHVYLSSGADLTATGLTVDGAGGTAGRVLKTTALRHSTLNSMIVRNGAGNDNGLALEYYSSHNTFNDCLVTNNSPTGGSGTGNAGINSFGNFNQFNIFNGCTVSNNGNVQLYISQHQYAGAQDNNDIIQNSTITGIGGTSTQGILVQASNTCINNNTFMASTSLSPGISVSNSTDMGEGNLLNGASSNLTSAACGTTASQPAAPSGLTATVQ